MTDSPEIEKNKATFGPVLGVLPEKEIKRIMQMSASDRTKEIERLRKYQEVERKNAERRKYR